MHVVKAFVRRSDVGWLNIRSASEGVVEATEADLRHGGRAVATSLLRQRYGANLMVNGGYDASTSSAVIAGEADLVSFGRPFIANPDLPQRLYRGSELNEPYPSTFYGGGREG